ncbi:hypothetical protein BGX26_004115 [Mortierella sp. AD094]|nr:hypothetical protein BGX26_004115 [Mortierella sp. AD094]
MDRVVFHARSIIRPTTATPATRGTLSRDEDVEDEDEDGDEEDNDGDNDGDNEEKEDEAEGEDEDNNWDIPARRYLILLAHLRKIILQDAATLMAEIPIIHDFKKQLLEQLAPATSPHSDSLAVTKYTSRISRRESSVT